MKIHFYFYKYLDETKWFNNFLHADIQLNVRENSWQKKKKNSHIFLVSMLVWISWHILEEWNQNKAKLASFFNFSRSRLCFLVRLTALVRFNLARSGSEQVRSIWHRNSTNFIRVCYTICHFFSLEFLCFVFIL